MVIFKKVCATNNILIMALTVFFFFYVCLGAGFAQEIDPNVFKQLKYRHIGPQGNRIIAVLGVPGDPEICYVGAASGGIFKSIDGGVHWEPIFDSQPVSSIGSLAIAPTDHNIVWAGTGESFIRSNISIGNGVYKSTDAGKNWQCMGLEKTGRIGRIIIDSKNADIAFAAALGHCYGPQAERGVFRTQDGGKSWERVLFVDENTGCSDLAIDPNNSRILIAGMWQISMNSWERWSGGPGSGLYMSRDGGTTWKRLEGHGLPTSEMGKIAVAVAPSNSDRIYALIETEKGSLWRSDDGGENWKLISRDHTLNQRPDYYSRCTVSPVDHNEVYFVATRFSVSLDGGETFTIPSRTSSPGGDNHDVWIDPLIPDRILVGNDNPGVSLSINRGKTWHRRRLPIAQMYHVYVDNQIPYNVYGNRQDGPSTRGPSNSLVGGLIPSGMWHSVGGNESGFAVPDPVENNIVWTGAYCGMLDRFDLRTGHKQGVSVWFDYVEGDEAADLKYRWQWTYPIAISPHDHNKVYVGSQFVHQTTDGGHTWKIISPDLSTNDKSKQQKSDVMSGPLYFCVIFALAESPLEEGLIWAGTNDGQVQLTRDGGENWTNVTRNIPNLHPWGTVSNIEPSRYDAGTCYITVDFHQMNNRDPYVYKTADYGQNWKLISSDIPQGMLSYAHCIREDPFRKGMLYLGTENALYVSFNDGAAWIPLQTNLPHAPVHWMVIQEHFNDLVVATYGRGFWILDDITPLQQLTPDIFKSDVYLFPPRPAYRFLSLPTPMSYADDQSVGRNPPYGASINYYLKSVPESDIKIHILDEKGQEIRELKGIKESGINRIWWDLRYEKTKEVKLRTSPIGAPHVKVGPKGWRSLVGAGGPIRVLVAPGSYTVKIAIDGQEFTQKLTVRKDPNSAGSEADIQDQVKLLLEVRDSFNNLVDMINQIEFIRKQLYDLIALLEGDESSSPIIKAARELDEKFIAVEENLFQMRLTGGTASQDILTLKAKLHRKISAFAPEIGKSDFPPTVSQYEVHEMHTQKLTSYQKQLDELIKKDLPGFNDYLKEKNISNIIVRMP